MIKHLACVMDGNRRWATQQGLAAVLGHKKGTDSVKQATEFCIKNNISYLTLYTFSIENFKRSEEEKNYLFDLIIKEAQEGLAEFLSHKIRVRFVGDRSLFPAHVLALCQEIEEKTAHLTTLTLNFLFCYGGQQEIVSAVQKIAQQVLDNTLKIQDITKDIVTNNLWLGDIPEPELIIRTGGVKRLSNFLLYQAAYSELYFVDTYWPDMTYAHFEKALEDFMLRKRNFGA